MTPPRTTTPGGGGAVPGTLDATEPRRHTAPCRTAGTPRQLDLFSEQQDSPEARALMPASYDRQDTLGLEAALPEDYVGSG